LEEKKPHGFGTGCGDKVFDSAYTVNTVFRY